MRWKTSSPAPNSIISRPKPARHAEAALAKGRQHGYRNAQVTVLAPTGTIAFLMDCDTTGVEPDIALVKYKLLAGGGVVEDRQPRRDTDARCAVLNYSEAETKSIIAHIEKFDTIEDVEENRPKLSPAASRRSICPSLTAPSGRLAASAASAIWRI